MQGGGQVRGWDTLRRVPLSRKRPWPAPPPRSHPSAAWLHPNPTLFVTQAAVPESLTPHLVRDPGGGPKVVCYCHGGLGGPRRLRHRLAPQLLDQVACGWVQGGGQTEGGEGGREGSCWIRSPVDGCRGVPTSGGEGTGRREGRRALLSACWMASAPALVGGVATPRQVAQTPLQPKVESRAGPPPPVLIFTGHFSWHIPSAAQVSSPLYWYSFSISASRTSCSRGGGREQCG